MNISFILVEPAVPENIGAAARAMKTMGFDELILVNPCRYLDGPAKWLAHASTEILDNAKVFSTLKDALMNFDFVIGTTAKKRSVKYDYYPLNKLHNILQEKGNTISKAALVFGREESGLQNDELKLCNIVSTVPIKTLTPSLNLAQAVMLYAWELSGPVEQDMLTDIPNNEDSLKVLLGKAKIVLTNAGFSENSLIYSRFLERISILGKNDIQLIHSFCNKLLERENPD